MFYRKHRPQKFADISKPNEVIETLALQLSKNKTSHAYLFIGSRGVGKTSTARILAKALNCENRTKDGDCCNECKNCKEITEGKFLDLIEIDAASNRGIDDIRTLKERVSLSPAVGKCKVYIIDEVHMLTTEAFNALLKTLEEPPKHVTFILCTTESHKVPETIKSRCQVFKFKKPSVKQIVERLQKLCEFENVNIQKSTLEKIAKAANGGFRDADTLLQQVVEGNLDIALLSGTNPLEVFSELTSYLIEGKTQAALLLLSKTVEEGVDIYNWSVEYVRYLRDILYIQAGFNRDSFAVTEDVFAKMEEYSSKLSSSEVVLFLDKFMKASNEIKGSIIPSLPLEIAIVELSDREKPTYYIEKATEISNTEVVKSTQDTSEDSLTPFDSVKDSWGDILKDVKPFNHSIEALLRSCKPVSLEKNTLLVEVAYLFHKERLESPKSVEIIEKVLANKFGSKIRMKCILKSKEGEALTDKNIELPKDDTVAKSALDVFDGGVDLNF